MSNQLCLAKTRCSPAPPTYDFPALRPPLPLWKKLFWIGLVAVTVAYIAASLGLHRLVGVGEFEEYFGHWYITVPLLALFMGLIYGLGHWARFADTRIGWWCADHLSSARVMVGALLALGAIWYMAWVVVALEYHQKWDAIPVGLAVIFSSLIMLWCGRDVLKKYGVSGIILKLAVAIDGIVLMIVWAYGSNPLMAIYRHQPARADWNTWLPVFGFALAGLVCSDWLMPWLMKRKLYFIVPAAIVSLACLWIVCNGGLTKTIEKYPPSVSELIAPSVVYASDGTDLDQKPKTDFQKWLDTPQGKMSLYIALGLWVLLMVVHAVIERE